MLQLTLQNQAQKRSNAEPGIGHKHFSNFNVPDKGYLLEKHTLNKVDLKNIDMKITLYISYLFLAFTSFCQDNFWSAKSFIVSEYAQMEDNNTIFQYKTIMGSSDFTVLITGTDSLSITHFFRPYVDGSIDDESFCDSLMITLLCGRCVENHLNKLLHSKERKWVKLYDSLYVSQKWVSKFNPYGKSSNEYTVPMMCIQAESSKTRVIIYPKIMTKQQWKELKVVRPLN